MLFSTFTFFLFLPLVYVLYWYVFNKHIKIQNVFLLVASYVFYGWWSWKFCGLLLLSTLIDYSFGFLVASPSKKKAQLFLTLSIINNLGLLFLFKYYNFFALEFKSMFELIGWQINPILLKWGLPIGISFYTFHGMSYVFDIYRGAAKPVRSFVNYALFVSFFPLLVAGPIERSTHLLPQLQTKRVFSYQQSVDGLRLLLWGLFKKVVIADTLAPIIDSIYLNVNNETGYTLFLGLFGFLIQIYTDFSAYADMAIGMAKLLGFELLSNFNYPILGRDNTEFWRRWHISLMSWINDYILVSLGGIRMNKFKAVRNVILVFLISGFWHGASWNFLMFGFVHAMGFIPFVLFPNLRIRSKKIVGYNAKFPTLNEAFRIAITFSYVSFSAPFFRLFAWHDAILYYKRMVLDSIVHWQQYLAIPTSSHMSSWQVMMIPFLVMLRFVTDWYLRHNERSLRVPSNYWVRNAVYLVVSSLCLYKMVVMSVMSTHVNFVYFQF